MSTVLRHSPMDKKRCRDDSDESPETKRLRANLLDILEDVYSPEPAYSAPNPSPDSNPVDLVTVMKSFEEEIGLPASDSAEAQPDLGYLLEASDDELGLPPTFSGAGNGNYREIDNYSSSGGNSEDLLADLSENKTGGVAAGLDQIWGFDDEIPSFDLLEYGFKEDERKENDESLVFGGLFDYSDDILGEQSMFSWRPPESLPAVQ